MEPRCFLKTSRCTGSFPLYLLAAVFGLMAQLGACNVVLMANHTTLSFDDVEATFTPAVKGSGVNGVIYATEPLDACGLLRTKPDNGSAVPFALVVRGGCQFDDKVRNAQDAGFKAVIVYDDEDSGVLVSMAGSSSGIHIYAVFISKSSGEVLQKYSGQSEAELWIIPTYENSAWSIMAVSFMSLLAMSAVLATCFFLRRCQIRRERGRIPRTREFHGMSSQIVKAMPSLIFTRVQEDNCTSSTCAICLEDYSIGEKLRVLPCRHKFHAACVDLWLTSWRTFCPVCKQDANTGTSNPPVSESTPLLSSAIHLPVGSSSLAPFRSTVSLSPPRPISRHPSSPSMSRTYSASSCGIPCCTHNLRRSSANSPPTIRASGSRSHPASTLSTRGGHLSPPINIMYDTPHVVSRSGYESSSSGYTSSSQAMSYSGRGCTRPMSSGHQHPYLRHRTLSGPSLYSMVPQSPPQETLLQHGGNSETSLTAAASAGSFCQLYLRQRRPDSDTSAESLPGC